MTPIDPAETPEIVTVANGFCVRQAIDNMAWLDLGEYAVIIDALAERELAEEVFAAICATVGDKEVRYVINTHTHSDHVALNTAFQRRFGTKIINQHTCRIPAEGRWFEGSLRCVMMLPMPVCHTDEDCIIWIPNDKALFVGDIFGWGLIPLSRPLDDGAAELLLDTYARMIEYDAAVVVPGHGPLCTTAELKRWVEYFRWLVGRTSAACREGRKEPEITAEVTAPQDMRSWWRFLQWKHEDSLAKVLAAVKGGRLTG